jgi:hypothetical protein
MRKTTKTLVTLLYDLGADEIQWANMIILEKACMSFFSKNILSYGTIFVAIFYNKCFLVVQVHDIFFSFFLINMNFWNCHNSL